MLSLNTVTQNSLPLRPQDAKSRPRQGEEQAAHADFHSYLASALQQQPQAELPREQSKPLSEQGIPERTNTPIITELRRPESAAEYHSVATAQKAGMETPRESETVAENLEKTQEEQAKLQRRAVTITRSDRELLEALGLINRKTEIAAQKPVSGTLRTAMNAVTQQILQKPEKKPVNFKGDSLTLLEKSPDLVLMSSDGLRKLGEKLGRSLLGKIHEKISEKNRPTDLYDQLPRGDIRTEQAPAVVQWKSQKAGAANQEPAGEQQESRSNRQAAAKNVSRETSSSRTTVNPGLVVSENTPIPTASAHESSTLRAQTNFLPASEIRLAEVASVGRAAESMRSAVENPLLRPELVRQFNEIISRAQVLITDTQNAQFSVRLFPREIGRLEIDLKLIEGEIRGKIVVESENVKNELENFLQNREHSGSREFDLNKIDIEVRSGNQNAQNPQQAPDTQEVLQNLVTQAASEAYSTIESSRVLGNALYA